VTLKMPAFEWVHVQLHQQKGMISLSPPTICNSATKTAVVPVHEATFRVGGTDFGVLNDDVFNSENRLSARGFLPPHRAVI
uniref:hypothetical protein n=1 Tax=Escherichia coli TaxID=562 RepID=UPI003F681263